MSRKLVLALVLLVALAALVVPTLAQLASQGTDHTRIGLIVGTTVLDYNILGPDRFRARLLQEFEMWHIPIQASDIEIVEDRATGRAVVTVRYTRTLRLLFIPIERHMVVTKETTNLSM